jgi:hypothetical protein
MVSLAWPIHKNKYSPPKLQKINSPVIYGGELKFFNLLRGKIQKNVVLNV